jgi:hypothetical protein
MTGIFPPTAVFKSARIPERHALGFFLRRLDGVRCKEGASPSLQNFKRTYTPLRSHGTALRAATRPEHDTPAKYLASPQLKPGPKPAGKRTRPNKKQDQPNIQNRRVQTGGRSILASPCYAKASRSPLRQPMTNPGAMNGAPTLICPISPVVSGPPGWSPP